MTAASKKIPNLLGRAALNRDDIFQERWHTYCPSLQRSLLAVGQEGWYRHMELRKGCGINTITCTFHGVSKCEQCACELVTWTFFDCSCDLGGRKLTWNGLEKVRLSQLRRTPRLWVHGTRTYSHSNLCRSINFTKLIFIQNSKIAARWVATLHKRILCWEIYTGWIGVLTSAFSLRHATFFSIQNWTIHMCVPSAATQYYSCWAKLFLGSL